MLRTTFFILAAAAATTWAAEPTTTAWYQNNAHRHGSSTNATLNASLSLILADVQQVRATASDSYINATGIPSYPIGVWQSNPNTATAQNFVARFPKTPTAATTTHTNTGLGAIGLWIDGVAFFNAKDARSYQSRGIWNQNAFVVEGVSFDTAGGHPAPNGAYHHHQRPIGLLSRLNDDGTTHSALLGYAYDGFPVYGPYGYANTSGGGGIARMTSSYRLRNITQRTTLADGTVLAAANYGPAVSTTYPLGYYLEDYEYVGSLGTLNQYNGRICVTPEYPNGTFAYFTTIDAAGASAYPYIVGPQYYGVVLTDDTQRTVSVPAGAARYISCAADFNADGVADFFDYLDFVDAFSQQVWNADVNRDGSIDFFDYLDFVDTLSRGC